MFNKEIKLIATDFDGIITDGFVYYSSNDAQEMKRISYKDIMGLSLALKNDYILAIISGEKTPIIDKLASKFKMQDVHQGIRDKASVIKSISEKYSIPFSQMCYLGDDINDIPVLEKVAIPVTVPQANYKVKSLSQIYVTESNAGDGAFREVIDSLLKHK